MAAVKSLDTDYEKMTAEEKIQLAKLTLLASNPFFSSILMKINLCLAPGVKDFLPVYDLFSGVKTKEEVIEEITKNIISKSPGTPQVTIYEKDPKTGKKKKKNLDAKQLLSKLFLDNVFQDKDKIIENLISIFSTMGVDNRGNCFYNPFYVNILSRQQLIGVLCHEVMHIVFLHCFRSPILITNLFSEYPIEFKHRIGNIAADAIINDILVNMEDFKLPGTDKTNFKFRGYIPNIHGILRIDLSTKTKKSIHRIKARDKSFEQLFVDIMKRIDADKELKDALTQQKGQSVKVKLSAKAAENSENQESTKDSTSISGNDNVDKDIDENDDSIGSFDDHGNWNTDDPDTQLSDKEREDLEQKWKDNVANAVTSAKAVGKANSWTERLIEDLVAPKLNWRAILSSFIQNTVLDNYSYLKPAKKSITLGYYNPIITKKPEELIVAIDVSGSINETELVTFLSEVKGIVDNYPKLNIRLLYWSTEVDENHDLIFNANNLLDALEIKPYTTGGTYLSCVEDYLIKTNTAKAAGIVYLTDGYIETAPEFVADSLKRLFIYTQNKNILTQYPEKGNCIQLDINS